MKAQTNIYNLIILDASGSMSSIYDQALAGVNETIHTIRKAQQDMPEQQQFLTLVSFATGGEPLEVMAKMTPINVMHDITCKDYTLRGSTALYDAIGDAVTELKGFVKQEDKAIVTIITDGYENDSNHWNEATVKHLISQLKEQGWLFTFIGANQDVEMEAGRVGIDNSLKFEATIEGTIEMFEHEGRSRRRWNERVYRGEEELPGNYFNEEDIDTNAPASRITPERIDQLRPGEIFVFGSSFNGHHDGGAARAARHRFGAQWGKGIGLQGQSYAIPTTGCTTETTVGAILEFARFAKAHPEMHFLVTAIGCGHGGYTPDFIALPFREVMTLPNVSLPQCFWQVLNNK